MSATSEPIRGPKKWRRPAGLELRSQLRSPSGDYRWVYLWGWPLRVVHWTSALAIVILVVTGLYIGRPYFLIAGEASNHFVMGWMRLVHFVCGGVLVAAGILRLYWFFMGNRYERFGALFPFSRKRLYDLWRTFRAYALIRPDEAPKYLGHNPLQQVAVTGLYFVILVMVCTGFALYGQATPDGLIARAFAWVAPLLGGMQVVRFVHHVLTWVVVIFVPMHIYLAIRHELLDHGAVVSSIISGGRFVSAQEHFEDA